MQGLRGENLIEGVEADVGDERHAPHQQRADVAELRPRLDHLRQAELRSLRRMKRHEEGAEGGAEQHRDRHPQRDCPPSATPTTPVATVARCASPENHTGHRCQTLPWRSAIGT